MLRAQYHFRPSATGLLAWDVRRLVALTHDLPVRQVPLHEIAELDENHWYAHEDALPSCRSVAKHAMMIAACDLSYPIILDSRGRVMDGMHRVCKALMSGHRHIAAVQFPEDPTPDYFGVDPGSLPYDNRQ